MTHDASWHEKRRQGIGGSDIAAILGMSRWSTPQKIYRLKVGDEEPEASSSAASRGQRLEGDVLLAFTNLTGIDVQPGYDFHRHPYWDRGVRIQANTDGKVVIDGLEGNFEAKTAALGNASSNMMQSGLIPPWYLTQVTSYMVTCQVGYTVLGMLHGPPDHDDWEPRDCQFSAVRMELNLPLAELIEDVCRQFWQCVEARLEPEWGQHPNVPKIRAAMERTQFQVVCPMTPVCPR